MKRSHHCGELTGKDVGKKVSLAGWVQRRRDHGGVIFVDLRDRYGITQVVFNPAKADPLRREYVIGITGTVGFRPAGMANPKMRTGEIEITVSELEVYNVSKTPPFLIEEECYAGED